MFTENLFPAANLDFWATRCSILVRGPKRALRSLWRPSDLARSLWYCAPQGPFEMDDLPFSRWP